jgi:hypothetical protein
MGSLLEGLPSLIAGIAGPLLFNNGVVVRRGSVTPDGRGGWTDADPEAYACKCLVLDYTDFQRMANGIPGKDRKIMVLGASCTVAPLPGDVVVTGGREWSVIEVTSDPANATYECQGRGGVPTEIAVAIDGDVDISGLGDLSAIFSGAVP